MADHGARPTLDSLVFDRASLPAYEIDRGGTIIRASRYAVELAGRNLAGRPFTSVLLDFASEFDLEDALASPGTRQLSVATQSGLPETFVFHFAEREGSVVALGEYPREDNEMLQATLLGSTTRSTSSTGSCRRRTSSSSSSTSSRAGSSVSPPTTFAIP